MPELELSYTEYDLLAEKGRRMAAKAMLDPESRARVEKAYGADYCRRRYPETYATLEILEKRGQLHGD